VRNLLSELLLAQSKKVKSERFAAPNASVTKGQYSCPFVVLRKPPAKCNSKIKVDTWKTTMYLPFSYVKMYQGVLK